MVQKSEVVVVLELTELLANPDVEQATGLNNRETILRTAKGLVAGLTNDGARSYLITEIQKYDPGFLPDEYQA